MSQTISKDITFNADTLLRAAYNLHKELYLWFGSIEPDEDGDEPASSISFFGKLADEMYERIKDLPIPIEEITLDEGMVEVDLDQIQPPLEAARSS